MNGLDTNVLLRMLLQDDPAQSAAATALVGSLCTAESPCFINRIVLCEAIWVLMRGYKYDRIQVARIIEQLLDADGLTVEDADDVRAALQIFRAGNVGFADCLIAVTNRSLGCNATLTFDRRAATLPGFRLVSGQ